MLSYLHEIQGQNRVKESLYKIFKSGKIPQAMLFVGPEGVGKFFTALQFLKLINSDSNEQLSNLNSSRINSFAEPYIKLIFPLPRGKNEADDNALQGLSDQQLTEVKEEIKKLQKNPYHKITINSAETIKISSIREINNFTSLKFDDLQYRMIAILNADSMSEEAQNALLKNLEEPPEGIIFVLFTTDDNNLLTTIKSRCWKIQFEPLNDDVLVDILSKYYNYSYDEIVTVKYFSDGSVRNAMYLMENEFNIIINKTLNILRYSFAGWYNTAISEFKEILKNSDYDLMKLVIKLIYTWLNNLVKYRDNGEYGCFPMFIDSIAKFNSKFDNANLDDIFLQIDTLNNYLDRNVNLNIVAVNIVLELAAITNNK